MNNFLSGSNESRCPECRAPVGHGDVWCKACEATFPPAGVAVPGDEQNPPDDDVGATEQATASASAARQFEAESSPLFSNENLKPLFALLHRARRAGTKVVVNIGYSGAGKSWLSARMGGDLRGAIAKTTLFSSDAPPDDTNVFSPDRLPHSSVHQVRVWKLPAAGKHPAMLLLDLAGELTRNIERGHGALASASGMHELFKIAVTYADALVFVLDGASLVHASTATHSSTSKPASDEFAEPNSDSPSGTESATTQNPASDIKSSGTPEPALDERCRGVLNAIVSHRLHRAALAGQPPGEMAKKKPFSADEKLGIPVYFAISRADTIPVDVVGPLPDGSERWIPKHDPTSLGEQYFPKTFECAELRVARFRWGLTAAFFGQAGKSSDGKDDTSERIAFERPSYGVKEVFDWLHQEFVRQRRVMPGVLGRWADLYTTGRALTFYRRFDRIVPSTANEPRVLRWRDKLRSAFTAFFVLAAILGGWLYVAYLKPSDKMPMVLPKGMSLPHDEKLKLTLSPDEAQGFDRVLLSSGLALDSLIPARLPPLIPDLWGDLEVWKLGLPDGSSPGFRKRHEAAKSVFAQMRACGLVHACGLGEINDLGEKALRLVSTDGGCSGEPALWVPGKLERVPQLMHAAALSWHGGCDAAAAARSFSRLRDIVGTQSLQPGEKALGIVYARFQLAKLDLRQPPEHLRSFLETATQVRREIDRVVREHQGLDKALPELGISLAEIEAEQRLATWLQALQESRTPPEAISQPSPLDVGEVVADAGIRRLRFATCAAALRYGNNLSDDCLRSLRDEKDLPEPIRQPALARLAVRSGNWQIYDVAGKKVECVGPETAAACSLLEIAQRPAVWEAVNKRYAGKPATRDDVVARYLDSAAERNGNLLHRLQRMSFADFVRALLLAFFMGLSLIVGLFGLRLWHRIFDRFPYLTQRDNPARAELSAELDPAPAAETGRPRPARQRRQPVKRQ